MKDVFNFFVLFSIFEWALKNSTKFIRTPYANLSNVGPDWDKFGNYIEAKFNLLSNPNIDKILNSPPKIQILKDSRIEWIDDIRISKDIPKVKKVIYCLLNTRNNLFHWWKYETGFKKDSRNIKVLSWSKSILMDLIELNQDVKTQFLIEYEAVKDDLELGEIQ